MSQNITSHHKGDFEKSAVIRRISNFVDSSFRKFIKYFFFFDDYSLQPINYNWHKCDKKSIVNRTDYKSKILIDGSEF